MIGPINVTGYRYGAAAEQADEFHQPRKRKMAKVHIVSVEGQEKPRLVKAHTRAGAERHVRESLKPKVEAKVPTQDELIAALGAGVVIENATEQADLAAQGGAS